MAKNFPPDGLSAAGSTVWGTDVDHDVTVSNLVGDSCVIYNAVSPGYDPELITDFLPVEGGAPYVLEVLLRATANGAGQYLNARYAYYDRNQSYIADGAIWNALPLNAANAWEWKSLFTTMPSTARWVRIFVRKAGLNTFSAYLDAINIDRVPASFRAYATAGTSIGAGAWKRVDLAGSSYNYGGNFASHGYTARRTGPHDFSGSTRFAGVNTGKAFGIALYVDPLGVGSPALASFGTTIYSGAASANPALVVTDQLQLNASDIVYLYAYNGDSSARSTTSGSIYTKLSGREAR